MKRVHNHIQPHIEHVIWDWNGTLLSDVDHAVDTVNRLLSENGLPSTTLENYKRDFGFPVVDYYKKLGFPTTRKEFIELCEVFNRYFLEGMDRCTLWPGANEALQMIRLSGKTQSLLSASFQEILDWSVKQFGVDAFFHYVVGVNDKAASSKVNRGHDLIAMAKIDPEKTLLIGDTDHDLEVAEALGIDALLVDHGHQCKSRLLAVHDRVVTIVDPE